MIVIPDRQVKKLLDMHKVKVGKNDAFVQAWDLRRLYTFAFRRQNDAVKRSQTPRDPGAHMFAGVCLYSFIMYSI